jgi:predicted RNase H-like HicB family nuclease
MSTVVRTETDDDTPIADRPFKVDFQATLTAIVTPEADGRFSVEVPALPGCLTCGDTLEEVRANLIEASAAWLATRHDIAMEEAKGAAPDAGQPS